MRNSIRLFCTYAYEGDAPKFYTPIGFSKSCKGVKLGINFQKTF